MTADNDAARQAWETNAAVWDERMGMAGNDFVNVLIWPRTQRLLDVRPGERALDIARGNGLYALRLADLGAQVTA
ncbi:MAG TPA: class I SAM-dependent methyltransferase, partial [Promineifilum sp.]|nr:class I SAM-dependent methyltransferase [Promineifilum sp.]